MLRYALDSLGWFDFEGLIQALLKARLGLGVEAWGGSGDWGRDAWYEGPLRYPSNVDQPGPFCFQCKFVDAANAAGARPEGAVLAAVRKEATRISWRKHSAPSRYVLFTNACIGGKTRAEVTGLINAALPSATAHVHDGNDICAWLDNSADVARRFPQLLGLRDLDVLLANWVNRDVLTRSREALHEAEELARVFVPTNAYRRAVKILQEHHFVILEGAPEMGKTAIGRMIALTMVAGGWEAIECRRPEDIERAVDNAVNQVFVADDFFGRGEYEPSRVSAWEAALPTIMRLLGNHKKLILTTRAHLLNLARLRLDLPGETGRRFPTLGEILIDAGDLAPIEKARILYRHLKRASLPEEVRKPLRQYAPAICGNPHFTPERIRRFVAEALPDSINNGGGRITDDDLVALINQSLSNPTQGMRVTFRALPPSHKWLLFALVESERAGSHPLTPKLNSRGGQITTFESERSGSYTVKSAYERLCPHDALEPYEDVEHALGHAFVRPPRHEPGPRWVHPSCRDLTIQELRRDARFRRHFLSRCSLDGIALAISIGGGSEGDWTFPLLASIEDWSALAERSMDLFDEDPQRAVEVVSRSFNIASLPPRTESQEFAAFIFGRFWPEAVARLNTLRAWTIPLLSAYFAARDRLERGVVADVPSLLNERKLQALQSLADPFGALIGRPGLFDWLELVELLDEWGVTPPLSDLAELTVAALAIKIPSPQEILGETAQRCDELSSSYSYLAKAFQKLAQSNCGGDSLVEKSAVLHRWSEMVAEADPEWEYDEVEDYGSGRDSGDYDGGDRSGGDASDIFNDL